MKKTFLASILAFCILFMMSVSVISVGATGGGTDTNNPVTDKNAPTSTVSFELDNPFGNNVDSLFDLLAIVIEKIIFPIGGTLAVLAFIYSGFLYVTAQGDTSKIKTAHTALLYTAVGTAVLLGARVIAEVIRGTINQLQ